MVSGVLEIAIFDDDDLVAELADDMSAIEKHCTDALSKMQGSGKYRSVKIALHQISSDEAFRANFEYCCNELNGIGVFDLRYKDIREHLQLVDRAINVAGNEQIDIATNLRNFMELDAGLVLAIATLTSKANDADVYLASINSQASEELCNNLEQFVPETANLNRLSKGIRLFDSEELKKELCFIIQKFIKKRSEQPPPDPTIEELIWPKDSKRWFETDARPVDHDYGPVQNDERYQNAIKSYLKNLTGRTISRTVDQPLHEFLKTVIGCKSRTFDDTEKYIPGVGCILLMLAAAERKLGCVPSTGDWFSDSLVLADQDSRVETNLAIGKFIMPDTVSMVEARKALVAIYEMFLSLLKHKDTGNLTLKHVNFFRSTCSSLFTIEIIFAFDCRLPSQGKGFSLLEISQNLSLKVGGEVAKQLLAIKDICRDNLMVSILPTDCFTSTRFVFYVR